MADQKELLNSIGNMFDQKVQVIVNQLTERISKNEVRTEEAHKRLDDVDVRIDRLARASSSNEGTAFVPNNFTVRGICEYKDKDSTGITWVEAEQVVFSLKDKLCPTLQSKIGATSFIDVHAGSAADLSFTIEDLLKDEQFHRDGNRLYTTVQQDPVTEKRCNAGGRAKAFLKSHIGDQGLVECAWDPDWQIKVGKAGRVAVVASINLNGHIQWVDKGCQSAFNESAEATQKAYKASKQ